MNLTRDISFALRSFAKSPLFVTVAVLSLAFGIVTLPLVLLVVILIKLESRGPAFYHHTRIGRGLGHSRKLKRGVGDCPGGRVVEEIADQCVDRRLVPADADFRRHGHRSDRFYDRTSNAPEQWTIAQQR